jgi:putative transposase
MRKPYPTDLTDAQWELVASHIPPALRGGAPRRVDIRDVLNAVLYITRSGCQWRLLPHEFPSWRTVHTYFSQWRNNGTWERLCDALRERVRDEQHSDFGRSPATARIDSQSVKGAGQADEIGTDGGKKVRGRKRHIAVDSLGLLLAVAVTAANMDDARAAPRVLERLPDTVRDVYADSKYHNYALYGFTGGSRARYKLRIVSRPPGVKGWVTLPRRWVVERTFGWLGRYRRHDRDHEKLTASSEAFVRASCVDQMLNRLRPRPEGFPFRYRAA